MAVIDQKVTDRYAIYNGDSCEWLPTIPDDSIHHIVYSPPFSDLYNYSSSDRDLSNCKDYDEFLEHYKYIIEQTSRVLMPGRIAAVHCMDLKLGTIFNRDFPGDIIRLHAEHGMHFLSRIHIPKEPLAYALKTRLLKLRHGQIVKDATKCAPAGADYLIVFRKAGENRIPVTNPMGFQFYAGERQIPPKLNKFIGWEDPQTNKRAHWIWQQYASTFWDDIRVGRVLPHQKEKKEEKHICPLQLDVIERSLQMWSNEGEKVLTPFLGVGSEVYVSITMNRLGIGCELKSSYYRQSIANCESALSGANDPDKDDDMFASEVI